jgi:hypothetical protein
MTTTAQELSDANCLTKLVRSAEHTDQAKTTASKLHKRKRRRPNEELLGSSTPGTMGCRL